MYLSTLKTEDTYNTLTFAPFWKNIIIPNSQLEDCDFVERNREALSNGAAILRTLIVDKNALETANGEYFSLIKEIIKINIQILTEYPNNYEFRIFFTEKHDEYRKEYYNFAIINRKYSISEPDKIVDDRIIFAPSNVDLGGSSVIYIEQNESYNEGKKSDSRKPPLNQANIKRLNEKLKEINDLWSVSSLGSREVEFLKLTNIDFFNKKNRKLIERVVGKKNWKLF